MKSKRSRLDRFLSHKLSIKRGDVRVLLAQGRVTVDGRCAKDIQQLVDEYTCVQLDQQLLQNSTPSYIALYKPKGVVSATKDSKHTTVNDLLPKGSPANLHIVGRLDFNSTGLVLMTNDGRWSRRLSEPGSGVKKRYRVVVDKPITQEVVDAFKQGIYFRFENLTTRPASLLIIDSHSAEVTLEEGRYHQIKRMFGRFHITVLQLHRFAIGSLLLDDGLPEGGSRPLTVQEITTIA